MVESALGVSVRWDDEDTSRTVTKFLPGAMITKQRLSEEVGEGESQESSKACERWCEV